MDESNTKFIELFGDGSKPLKFFCPGRVNLIGEHIDYLGGEVLPCAISLGITCFVRKTGSSVIRLSSGDFEGIAAFNSSALPQQKEGKWSDYILGVLVFLRASGVPISGFDMLIESSLPKGSGLSSSAALEVLVYYALSKVFAKAEPDRTEMALDCQRIENEFIGVNCGIMDQFAVANGLEHHAIKLNCSSLHFEYVPIDLEEHSLLIINTNKPRELAESAYNTRREECAEALWKLQEQDPLLTNLVDANLNAIGALENEIIRKRAKHAISEHKRVQESVHALASGNMKLFGKLMNASHHSLSDDFEVSCDELDFIASFLQKHEGCLGARMTGAGFGGCCVALIRSDSLESVSETLKTEYRFKFGHVPSFYASKPSDGVRMLTND